MRTPDFIRDYAEETGQLELFRDPESVDYSKVCLDAWSSQTSEDYVPGSNHVL